MATNDTATDNQQADIIEQIGAMLPALYAKPELRPKEVALLETFDLWELDLLELVLEDLPRALLSGQLPLLQPEYQHHQIKIDGRAQAYALSQKSASGRRKVVKVAISSIAERIDEAIDHLDHDPNIPDDTPVRLVVVRSCLIYAFWLVERQQVYIISVPARFREILSVTYLDVIEFLRILYEQVTRLMAGKGLP